VPFSARLPASLSNETPEPHGAIWHSHCWGPRFETWTAHQIPSCFLLENVGKCRSWLTHDPAACRRPPGARGLEAELNAQEKFMNATIPDLPTPITPDLPVEPDEGPAPPPDDPSDPQQQPAPGIS
jgi:hypothetical protein